MIVAYILLEQDVYVQEKRIHDEDFAIYDYLSRKYRFVGCFSLVDRGYADVYEINETQDDSRLMLIAALQIRGKTQTEIEKFCNDIDAMKLSKSK